MSRKQCEHCPWKQDTDPHEIPNGYCPTKHAALTGTIATGSAMEQIMSKEPLRIMACHETHELPCVGWLHNQRGEGNNINLRVAIADGRISGDVEVIGPQHSRFEDTLPEGCISSDPPD